MITMAELTKQTESSDFDEVKEKASKLKGKVGILNIIYDG